MHGKPIQHYENYRVYPEGCVRNTKTGRTLKAHVDARGSLYVTLSREGIRENFMLARLVAEYYKPNPREYPFVRFLDGNCRNCRVDNLKWAWYTNKQEQQYASYRRKHV